MYFFLLDFDVAKAAVADNPPRRDWFVLIASC